MSSCMIASYVQVMCVHVNVRVSVSVHVQGVCDVCSCVRVC